MCLKEDAKKSLWTGMAKLFEQEEIWTPRGFPDEANTMKRQRKEKGEFSYSNHNNYGLVSSVHGSQGRRVKDHFEKKSG